MNRSTDPCDLCKVVGPYISNNDTKLLQNGLNKELMTDLQKYGCNYNFAHFPHMGAEIIV